MPGPPLEMISAPAAPAASTSLRRRGYRESSRPVGYPSSRETDTFYDRGGQTVRLRECHDTADTVFFMENEETGIEARIYQGGIFRVQDLNFLKSRNITLVVNCTTNIEAPEWFQRREPDAPEWTRFPVAGQVLHAHDLALACAGAFVHGMRG